MTGRATVLVFGKVPVPGKVKTRLTEVLTPDDTARLYEAFLQDTLDALAGLDADVRLLLAPSDESLSHDLMRRPQSVGAQRGDGLGQRMLNAFVEAFAGGFERAVIVGSDHPTLPASFVDLALQALEEPYSITIGPATDGGYYLIGMNELYPGLFQDMTYSQSDVFDRTLDRAAETEAGLTILPEWYDVDTPEALVRLVDELQRDESVAPASRSVLAALPVWTDARRRARGKSS